MAAACNNPHSPFPMRSLLLLHLSAIATLAAPVADFTTALEQAKTAKSPIAVLVHGSDWNRPGELLAKAWLEPKFQQELGDAVLTVMLDLKEQPTPAETAAAKRNEGCQPPFRSLPAIALYDCDGRLVALRSGVAEIRAAGGLGGTLKAMRRLLAERDAIWRSAHGQAGPRRAVLLGNGLDLMNQGLGPKNCYQPVLDDLRKADPKDESGYLAKYAFSPWTLLESVMNRAAKKEFAAAERETAGWLANPRLSPRQRQEVHAARFALYQRWPERQASARTALEDLRKADPKSDLGIAAESYLKLLKDA